MKSIKLGLIFVILFFVNVFSIVTTAAGKDISTDYTGYYIGVLTNADGIATSEDENLTIGLDGNYYKVASSFDFTEATRIWVEEDDKVVVCEFNDGEVVRVGALKNIIKPVFMINSSPDSFVYQNGKYQKDTITVRVKVGMEIKDTTYDSEMMTMAKGDFANIESVGLTILSEELYFVDSNLHNINIDISVPFGETEINSYKIKINKEYVPEKINTNIEVAGEFELHGGTKFKGKSQYISVGNIDLQKSKKNTSNSSVNVSANAARVSLDSNVAVALDSNFANYFTKEQQDEIQDYLTIWLAEIIESQKFKSDNLTENLQEKIRSKICNKLGVSMNTYLISKTIRASTMIIGDTISYGKRKIKVSVEIIGYSLDEDSASYATFGKLEYEVINKKDISEVATSGNGMITYANLETFAKQISKIADSAINGMYNEIWGKNATKVAALFTNLPFEKLLDGEFADNAYTLLKKPTENYLKKISIKCPVDVYVYNWDGKICGEIKDNVVNPEYQEVVLNVNEDEKNIYLLDDYIIRLVGNNKGEMEYDIEEWVDGELQRSVRKTEVPLTDNITYYALLPEMAIDYDVFELTDKDGEGLEFTYDSNIWNGEISETFSGGDGSRLNPFQIASGEELAKLAADVNSGNSYEDTHFILTNDIVLNRNISGSIYDYSQSLLNQWNPIGYWNSNEDYSYFKGYFDGNNHMISNMIITGKRFSGLFGEIEDATVENVHLENVIIYQSADYNSTSYSAAIAAYVEPDCIVRNCIVNGHMYLNDYYENCSSGGIAGYSGDGVLIENCTNYIAFSGSCRYAGGIVGYTDNTRIVDCVNKGIVGDAQTVESGGIVGRAGCESNISDCENYGEILGKSIGGIAGVNYATIYDCINYADIREVESYAGNRVGGIVGSQKAYIIAGADENTSHENGIIRCINWGEIETEQAVGGGIVGRISADTYFLKDNEDIKFPYIQDCENHGDILGAIVGGIAGRNEACIVKNCFNRGDVSANDELETYNGGIIGIMVTGYRDKDIPYVCNVYSTGIVSGNENVGSIVGYVKNGVVSNAYYETASIGAVGKSEGSVTSLRQIVNLNMTTIEKDLNLWVLSQENAYCFWTLDETGNINDGYPYLYKELSENNIELNEKQLSVSVKVSGNDNVVSEAEQRQLYIISKSDEKYNDVLWASSDERVVAVDSNGLITAIGEGLAVVRCLTDNYSSAHCTISVVVVNDDSDTNSPIENTGSSGDDTPDEPKVPTDTPDEPKVPADTPDEPKVPADTPDEPKVPADTPDEPKAPADTPDEPKVPADMLDEPKAPADTPDEPKVPPVKPDIPETPIVAPGESLVTPSIPDISIITPEDSSVIPSTPTDSSQSTQPEILVDIEKRVTKVKITSTATSVKAGQKLKLKAVVTPKDAANSAVTWSSSNKKYATVNSKGVVKAKKAGLGKTVKITAKAKDGSGKKATIKIKIVKATVTKILITATRKSVKAGQKVTLKAIVKPSNVTTKKVTWSSSNKKFATVNSQGVVKTKKAGKGKTVIITAKAKDGSGTKTKIKIKIK